MSQWDGCPTIACKNDLCRTGCERLKSEDRRMLERVARKAVELMDDDVDPDKTVGQWRREMAALLNEVVFYVAAKGRLPAPL